MKTFYSFLLTAVCFFAITNKAFGQFSGGDGSENNPYIITTAEQLAQLATFVNNGNESYDGKFYKLGNDISLSAYQSGAGWTPIGYGENYFNGNFDGNGKKITDLYINNPNLDFVGLFGQIYGSEIKNLAVESVNVHGKDYVGGITGDCYASRINDCYSTGNVSGNSKVGGVAGITSSSTFAVDISWLSGCYFTGNVTGNDYVGGITGRVYYYSGLGSCYSIGKVSGNEDVGGVIGGIYNGAASTCYSISEVSGINYVGGIIGSLSGAWDYIMSLNNCVALNPSVKAAGEYVGRIAGYNGKTLYDNAAYDGILNFNGNATWDNKGSSSKDGEDMTLQQIKSDGTLGNRFKSTNGWTIQNGKLPGLFGQAVNMPAHLGGVGIASTTLSDPIRVYPNPVNEQLTINNEQLIINNVEIFDVMGRVVYTVETRLIASLQQSATTINISHLPSSVYFVKIYTENGVVTQKIIKK